MKKRLMVLWAVLLCACGLALASCGGSSDAGGSAGEQAAEQVVDPTEKFIGTWKLAAMGSQGVTIVGDFSMITDTNADMTFEVKEDGTGTATFGEDETVFAWELKDDDTLVMKRQDEGEAADGDDEDSTPLATTIDFVYQNDTLVGSMEDEESDYSMTLTKDGVMPDAPELDMEKATSVTSAEEVAGTYQLTALKMMGATMYGEPSALAAIYGTDEGDYATLVIGEDGSVTFMGEEATATVGDDGLAIDFEIFEMPIKQLDDMVLVDMSSLLGDDSAMFYRK